MLNMKKIFPFTVFLKNGSYNVPITRLERVEKHFFSSNGPSSPNQPLKLMDADTIIWPNLLKSFKNWIMTALIIRPYLDADFRMSELMKGARFAVQVVSDLLSTGKFEKLESDGLVTRDCLVEIQKNIAKLSLTQRAELSILADDIYFAFPYEVGIIFDDTTNETAKSKRSVEIMVVLHALRGHSEMIKRGEHVPLNVGVLPEYREKIQILNYRFARDYTKGVTDSWTLNFINHMKPSEHLNES